MLKPQSLTLQPKEEMKVKRIVKWFRHRKNDDNWGRSVSDGWKLYLIQGSPPHSPISYTPDYHPDSLKARKIYSYKSLGLPDVLVARVLDCILIFGSLTHFFRSPRLPDCNCRTFSFSWDTSRKLGGVLSRGFRIIDSILSTLFYSAWNFVEE